jgi:hypothetical protein
LGLTGRLTLPGTKVNFAALQACDDRSAFPAVILEIDPVDSQRRVRKLSTTVEKGFTLIQYILENLPGQFGFLGTDIQGAVAGQGIHQQTLVGILNHRRTESVGQAEVQLTLGYVPVGSGYFNGMVDYNSRGRLYVEDNPVGFQLT